MSVLSFLLVFLLTQCATADVTYYVAAEDLGCPEGFEPCHNIDYYIANSTVFFSSDESNITMNFLGGTHTVAVDGDFELFGFNRLKMVGLSQNVVIKTTASQIPTWLIEGNEFHAKNITVIGFIFSFQVSILRISSMIFQGDTKVLIQPPSLDTTLYVVDAKFTRCDFKERSFLETSEISSLSLSDCKFQNISAPSTNSPMSVYHSMVYLSGISKFIGNDHSAISAFFSGVTVSGIVEFIDNTGHNGGALALYSSTLYINDTANVSFVNNTARNVGGAIFVNTETIFRPVDSGFSNLPCFFQLIQPSNLSTFEVSFAKNYATFGGNDIYGASLKSDCQVSKNTSLNFDVLKHFQFNTNSLSSVSGSPSRVCVCENDVPQCTNYSSIYITRFAYPGEVLRLPVAIVGGDYGTTKGTVYIGYMNGHGSDYYQDSQVVSNVTGCTNITLRLCSQMNVSNASLYLSTVPFYDRNDLQLYYTKKDIVRNAEAHKRDNKLSSFVLHTTPVFINITFLQCPPALYLSNYSRYYSDVKKCTDYYCDCHPQFQYNCKSVIEDGKIDIRIYTGWTGLNNETNTVLFAIECPFDYCLSNYDYSSFDPRNHSNFDDQCALNRKGTLCGGCKEGYSLAIGSSQCLKCSNDNGLALIILFAAAGIFLVFLISILNLTVSQGMINGLILYSSIVWSIRSIIIPQIPQLTYTYNYYSLILAWLNLDFGIETCFVRGLDAYWKTWLQFVFPFYTAGLFLVGLRFSSKLSKLFGDRSVPTLATLLFLSYIKLLRTIIAALGLAKISELRSADFSSNTTVTVWSVDGNVTYGEWKHILLVLAALACLLLLWLPYTMLLLLM